MMPVKYTHMHTFLRSLTLLLVICIKLSHECSAQIITTIAGGIGNDTTATIYSRMANLGPLIGDGNGNVYIGDAYGGGRIVNTLTNKITQAPYYGTGLFDLSGNLYYIQSNKIYKKTTSGATIHVAGNGSPSYSGDGSAATAAGMTPSDLTVDAAGNIYLCDAAANRLRVVNTSGVINTIAGTGIAGFSGDGSPATFATLNNPTGVAQDASGNTYIADRLNARIRIINSSGNINTLAPVTNLSGIKSDLSGNVYAYALHSHKVYKVTSAGISVIAGAYNGYGGDGGPATAAGLIGPSDISVDINGNIYMSEGDRLRHINPAGIINTIGGNGLPRNGYAGDGGNPLLALMGSNLPGLATDGYGNVYIADPQYNRVRKISSSGAVSTYAGNGITGYLGDGGPATTAALHTPDALATDKYGNLYISESGSNHIRKVTPAGIITTVAGGGTTGLGDGGPATAAQIVTKGVSVDTSGNIYIADDGAKRVRKVDAITGIITTYAGTGSPFSSGDGASATAAGFSGIQSVIADRKGNVFIGGNPIRKVDKDGIVTSLPASGNSLAVDTMGNLYISGGNIITRLDIYNYLTIIAGTGVNGYSGDKGPATAAQISSAAGIAIDTFGNLYLSTYNGARKICCLSNDIDKPPLFVKGATATLNSCATSGSIGIDTLLAITDGDIGDTEQWTVLSPPIHGTLSGFPLSATSTGDTITPSGFYYTPPPGYSGTDVFKIKVSDGIDTSAIQINVVITAPPVAGSIIGPVSMCEGSSISLFATSPGGTWSVSNGNVTISPTGSVTGISAGTTAVSYTTTALCGVATAVSVITINPLPYAIISAGNDSVCTGTSITLSGSAPGGLWSTPSPYINIGPYTGIVAGIAAGTAIVSYRVSNSCGIAEDTAIIHVVPPPYAGVITGVSSICAGDSTTLTSTVPGGVWGSGNPLVAAVNSSTGVVTGLASGAALITYEVISGGCGSAITSMVVNITTATPIAPITGSSSVCTGANITLTNGSPGGTWSSSSPSVGSVSSSGVVTGISPGITTISYTAALGCGSSVAIANITIHAAAYAGVLSGPAVMCTGTSAVMSSTSIGGVWSGSGNISVSPSGIVTGISAGTGMVSYIITNSCGADTAFYAVTVHPSPIAGTISGPSTMCAGDITAFSNPTATPGGTWIVSDVGVAGINSAGVVTATAAGTVIVSYTVATGCSIVRALKTVTVNVPSAGIITGSTYVCAGSTTPLTSTIPGGTWNSTSPDIATVSSSGAVTAVTGGVTVISYSVTGTCGTAYSSVLFTVGTLPVVAPISGISNMCAGDSYLFTNATTGGTWSSSNTLAATISPTGNVTANTAGVTTLSYIVTAGCGSAGVAFPVLVDTIPPSGYITGADTICSGATSLYVSTTPGGTWNSSNPFIASVDASGNVNGTGIGSATISYGVANACGASLQTKGITVKITDAGIISGLTTVCSGTSTTLVSTVPGGIWSSSLSAVATIGSSSGVVSASAPGSSIISYNVSDACGTAMTTILFTVGTTPVVPPITGPEKLCINASALYTDGITGGIWKSSDTSLARVDNRGIVTGIKEGTCTISYTISAGCGTSSAGILVTIEKMQEPDFQIPPFLCAGKTITLDANISGGIWESSSPTGIIDGSGILTGISSGDMSISYTLSNSCGDTSVIHTLEIADKIPAGTITGNTYICSNNASRLENSVTGGNWSSANTGVASIDIYGSVTGANPGTALISYTVTNKCGENYATTIVNILPLPVITAITGKTIVSTGSTVLLQNAVPGGYWSSSDTTIARVDEYGNVKARASGSVIITYSLVNSYGCTVQTTADVLISDVGNGRFSVYPNPSSGLLTIEWDNAVSDIAEVIVTDMTGRKIFTIPVELPAVSGKDQINLSMLPSGVYMINILSKDKTYVGRISLIR